MAIELVEVMGISLTGDVSYSVMNVKGMVTSDLNVHLPNAKNSNAGSVKVLVTLKLSVQMCSKEEKFFFLSFNDTEFENEYDDEHMMNLVALVSEQTASKSAVESDSDDDGEIDPSVEYRKLYDN